MLTLHLKKVWFEKIKSGEKTHEYRTVTDYWFRRLFLFSKILNRQTMIPIHSTVTFCCGYPAKDDSSKRLKAKIKSICIRDGMKTDLKVNKKVFDINFELIKE